MNTILRPLRHIHGSRSFSHTKTSRYPEFMAVIPDKEGALEIRKRVRQEHLDKVHSDSKVKVKV